ncbi:MAG: hypothetical protein NVS3B26_09000 [Mycobacteriales bacterium]
MPTARPRVLVTETDELKLALDQAARRWPGESRSALLVRLALEGHQAAQAQHAAVLQGRIEAVDRWSGSFSDGYQPGLLERIREDWPA